MQVLKISAVRGAIRTLEICVPAPSIRTVLSTEGPISGEFSRYERFRLYVR